MKSRLVKSDRDCSQMTGKPEVNLTCLLGVKVEGGVSGNWQNLSQYPLFRSTVWPDWHRQPRFTRLEMQITGSRPAFSCLAPDDSANQSFGDQVRCQRSDDRNSKVGMYLVGRDRKSGVTVSV